MTALIQDGWFHLGYMGAMLILFAYNLLFFFIARDKAYVFYAFYLLSNAAYSLYVWMRLDPSLSAIMIPDHPEYLDYFALQIFPGIACYGFFLQAFLDLEHKLPKWHNYLNYFIYLAIPLGVICLFVLIHPDLDNEVATAIMALYILAGSLFGIFMSIPLFRTGDKTAYFFIAGLFLMVTGVFFAASSFLRFGRTPLFLRFFQIGSLLEVICFSLGLGYKQFMNEREKQKTKLALITAQMLQEKEQNEARRLQELDQIKTRFYANITHEFRTPLTVIMGMIDNIRGYDFERNLVRRNSRNLLRLVNQLLDLSKLESGAMKINWVQGDIIPYLQYLTESFSSAAQHKDIQLSFTSEVPRLIMDYDEDKIQQIIYNLISNALKFTPPGGNISIQAHRTKGDRHELLTLKVKDTGAGIPADQLPFIFDRFFQVDGSTTRKGEGTGIGLALVRELVTQLGGDITVESEIDKGTTFQLQFPVKQSVATPAKKITAGLKPDTDRVGLQQYELDIADTAREIAPTEGKPLLLLIEDNQDVVSYIVGLLNEAYTIETAFDGQAGIDKALAILPDIIISDVMMPKKDGFEVCTTLKTDERSCHIPIIMLTAKATEADRLTGLKTGADAYLMKPFNKEELLIRLQQLVVLRQTLQQYYSNTVFTQQSDPVPPALKDQISNQDEQFLQKIHQLIDEKIGEADLNVDELCEAVHLSQSQLFRKMKALTGDPPSTFIRKIRLHKAKVLLQSTDLSISEIAYELGFTDPNYFSRAFSKLFDAPPSDFR